MRRLIVLAFSLVLIFALTVSVSAETGAPKVGIYATVASDGSCQFTVNVSLHLEQAQSDMTFPVPKDADRVALNGTRVRTSTSGNTQLINLSGILGSVAGEFNFTVTFNLDNVIKSDDVGNPELQLPLLSGFGYPVESLECSVTLPGEISAKPAFSSGYHQASIEEDLSTTVSGASITVQSLKTLKDHETLTMTLSVPETMFPDTPIALDNTKFDDFAMLICAVLALTYWILFLRAAPMKRHKSPTPLDGYSAGELGSVLTLQGAQLNMMVFTWAQLGYILIQLDRNERVLLHKRMEMGNERCGFERRCFQALFGDRRVVDTSGSRYAMLCKKTEKLSPNVSSLISHKSGNPRIFRLLAAGIGLFGGVALGIALGSGALLQWFWVVVLAAAGALSAWHVQQWADNLFLLNKQKLWKALGLCLAWILLAQIGGIAQIGILVALSQLLAGLMASFGGRRTDAGKQAAAQVLGLRRYLQTADRQELRRIQEQDPWYFHTMAPYALALGVDKAFAKRFGGQQLPACPYLTTGMDGHRTAAEWSQLMRRTVAAMERRLRQMPMERLRKLISSFKR